MDAKFTPWRREWATAPAEKQSDDGCVLCRLPAEESDRENLILVRGAHAFVVLNLNPYNRGHAMVALYEHTDTYDTLPESVVVEHATLLQKTVAALRAEMDPDGFNTGSNLGAGSGGSVSGHLHTHVIPRWQNDTDFLPLTGEVSVVADALYETYDGLYETFSRLEGVEETTEHGALRAGADTV